VLIYRSEHPCLKDRFATKEVHAAELVNSLTNQSLHRCRFRHLTRQPSLARERRNYLPEIALRRQLASSVAGLDGEFLPALPVGHGSWSGGLPSLALTDAAWMARIIGPREQHPGVGLAVSRLISVASEGVVKQKSRD
jgi:hypothetical protein